MPPCSFWVIFTLLEGKTVSNFRAGRGKYHNNMIPVKMYIYVSEVKAENIDMKIYVLDFVHYAGLQLSIRFLERNKHF